MLINEYVENSCSNKDSVWFLEGHKQFAYSDGDQVEKYIYKVINASSDISYTSRELETHIKDWASRYHLSRLRSLAYWPLAIPENSSVLEVGSGCGAITRYFGECAGRVLALEGSPVRASITRARTRDLANVEVLCASFQEVQFNVKFDVIICNGVFEYSACFVDGDLPYELILDKFKQLLNPGGTLLLAIENQFGLRYFSSSYEEHNQIMFDGIEGYARRVKGVRTFGYLELNQMLAKRFASVETLFPLPDYKLPQAVVRDKLLGIASCSELFGGKSSFDHGAVRRPLFHERLAWRELEKNGLLAHMANSFLFVVSDKPSQLLPEKWLGSNYSIQRRPCFTTETIFEAIKNGRIHVKKNRWHSDLVLSNDSRVDQNIYNIENWFNGPSLHSMVAAKMCEQQCGSLIDRLEPLVSKWWLEVSKSHNNPLPPDSVDMVWHNGFIDNDQVEFIDLEWSWRAGVSPEWLIVRTVSHFIFLEINYIHRWSWQSRFTSEWKIACAVARICQLKLSYSSFLKAIETEVEFQCITTGQKTKTWKHFIYAMLPLQLCQFMWITQLRVREIKVKLANIFSKMFP